MHIRRKGLCCISNILKDTEKLSYKTITRTKYLSLSEIDAHNKIVDITKHNIHVFGRVVGHCSDNEWNYRMPMLIPLHTLPQLNPETLEACKDLCSKELPIIGQRYPDVRFSMHPDQFCVLASKSTDLRLKSIFEIEAHAFYLHECTKLRTDFNKKYETPINIHMNCSNDHVSSIVDRFKLSFGMLSDYALNNLVVENEDKGVWTCEMLRNWIFASMRIPITFDYLHDACNPSLIFGQEIAFQECESTWFTHSATPLFHYSESIEGDKNPRKHADMPSKSPTVYGLLSRPHGYFDLDYEFKGKDYALEESIILESTKGKTEENLFDEMMKYELPKSPIA